MKKLIIILLIVSSCNAKKSSIEYKERIVKDTIIVNKERLVTQQIIDTLLVEKPCDSLGNLKEFDKEIRTEKAKVKLKSVEGNIEVSINLDSIVDQKIIEFKSTYKNNTDTKEVEVIRYKYPLWLILTAVFSIVINLILLRRFLPF